MICQISDESVDIAVIGIGRHIRTGPFIVHVADEFIQQLIHFLRIL